MFCRSIVFTLHQNKTEMSVSELINMYYNKQANCHKMTLHDNVKSESFIKHLSKRILYKYSGWLIKISLMLSGLSIKSLFLLRSKNANYKHINILINQL